MSGYDARGCGDVPNNGAKASRNDFVAWQFSVHSAVWKPQAAQTTKISDEKWSHRTIDSLYKTFLYLNYLLKHQNDVKYRALLIIEVMFAYRRKTVLLNYH